MLLALAEPQDDTSRLRRASQLGGFQTFLNAQSTRPTPYPHTSGDSVTSMPASTSGRASVIERGPFLLCDLSSESSRGYPDLSAQALNIAMIYKNEEHNVDGTSCSAPVRPLSSCITASSFLEYSVDRYRTDRGRDYLAAE